MARGLLSTALLLPEQENEMSTNEELIALVLADAGDALHTARAEGAQRLVRDALGRVTLEEVASQEEVERAARHTGCFRRGQALGLADDARRADRARGARSPDHRARPDGLRLSAIRQYPRGMLAPGDQLAAAAQCVRGPGAR